MKELLGSLICHVVCGDYWPTSVKLKKLLNAAKIVACDAGTGSGIKIRAFSVCSLPSTNYLCRAIITILADFTPSCVQFFSQFDNNTLSPRLSSSLNSFGSGTLQILIMSLQS